MYESEGSIHKDYKACARRYDEGSEAVFSRAQHEKWAKELAERCPVLRLDGTGTTEENAQRVIEALRRKQNG